MIYLSKKEANDERYFIMADVRNGAIAFSIHYSILKGQRWIPQIENDPLVWGGEISAEIVTEISKYPAWAAPMSPRLEKFVESLWESASRQIGKKLSHIPMARAPIK